MPSFLMRDPASTISKIDDEVDDDDYDELQEYVNAVFLEASKSTISKSFYKDNHADDEKYR